MPTAPCVPLHDRQTSSPTSEQLTCLFYEPLNSYKSKAYQNQQTKVSFFWINQPIRGNYRLECYIVACTALRSQSYNKNLSGWQKRSAMKSWEDMKEISYVGLKLTKAKSLNEGLRRCKIDKLTKKNPVYEHLQLHKVSKKLRNCPICYTCPDQSASKKGQEGSTRADRIVTKENSAPKRSKSEDVSRFNQNKIKLRDLGRSAQYSHYFDKLAETPREKVYKETKRFNQVIHQFDKYLRSTRSQFDRMCTQQGHVEDYFLTAVDDIELQINEDKGLSLRQIRTDHKAIKEDIETLHKKRKKLEGQVKKLKKTVEFPLNSGQIVRIVEQERRKEIGQQGKVKRMISSLYDYKSCANYSNRMKTIASIIQK